MNCRHAHKLNTHDLTRLKNTSNSVDELIILVQKYALKHTQERLTPRVVGSGKTRVVSHTSFPSTDGLFPCVCVRVCHVCMCVCMYAHMHIQAFRGLMACFPVCVCVYVCVYVCMYVCMSEAHITSTHEAEYNKKKKDVVTLTLRSAGSLGSGMGTSSLPAWTYM
jgi:hypothetical protein